MKKTRKLFGTDGVRGIAGKYPITAEVVLKLGKAAALVFKNKEKRSKILVGKDPRLSGYMLENAITSGILSAGADVLLVGPMPTPAIAHLTKSFAADAGIMISASHNPAEENGIKFFSNKGLKLSDEKEEEIEKIFFSEKINKEQISGKAIGKAYRIDDAKGRYIEFAKSSIQNKSLKGLKVVLDCANGAAYHIAPPILSELGAEVIVLNNKPDGFNINLKCGALHPEVIKRVVLENKAHVGIALDGDADRVIMVDEKGEIVNGDDIMAIAGLDLLKKGRLAKNTIVATVYSNLGLDEAIKKAGGKVVRVRNGDRYVIEEMLKNDYNFGGEQSGHIIFNDYSSTGDATIAALQILRIMKEKEKPLSELSNVLKKYPQVLINVDVKEKKRFEEMPSVMNAINEAEKSLKNKGRLLIRYSGTQNICRVMIEGKDKDLIKELANNISDKIREEIGNK